MVMGGSDTAIKAALCLTLLQPATGNVYGNEVQEVAVMGRCDVATEEALYLTLLKS